MHNDLPPGGLGDAVIAHRSMVAPDAAKALEYMRQTREMLDEFIERFRNISGFGVCYLSNPPRSLVGELVGTEYYMTAMANRLDLVIAHLERGAK
jgi:hypothetical protein